MASCSGHKAARVPRLRETQAVSPQALTRPPAQTRNCYSSVNHSPPRNLSQAGGSVWKGLEIPELCSQSRRCFTWLDRFDFLFSVFLYLFFLAALRGMGDLSSLTRD